MKDLNHHHQIQPSSVHTYEYQSTPTSNSYPSNISAVETSPGFTAPSYSGYVPPSSMTPHINNAPGLARIPMEQQYSNNRHTPIDGISFPHPTSPAPSKFPLSPSPFIFPVGSGPTGVLPNNYTCIYRSRRNHHHHHHNISHHPPSGELHRCYN